MRGLSLKGVVIGSTVVVLLILFALAQDMNRKLQVRKEVLALEQEVISREKSVIEMQQINQYFMTEAFQERMMREKLNYRAPGEKVVLIPEESSESVTEKEKIIEEEKKSTPLKWWDAFFAGDSWRGG